MDCKACGQEVPIDPASVIEQMFLEHSSWEDLYVYEGRQIRLRDGRIATVVGCDLSHDFEFSTNAIWIVFKVEGKLYKKTGWADSYGSQTWDTGLKEVQAKIKTVSYFE